MPSHFKCILIEDEKPAIEVLKNYLQNYEQLELRAHFANVFYAQDYLKEHHVDIIFLDINLPAISGLEFIKGLKNPPLIIITSAYDEHAVEAFDQEVFDYLLKPYSLNRFNRTVIRLKKHFSITENEATHSEQIVLKSGTQKVKLELDQIDYVESQREYLLFFIEDGEPIKTRMTIQDAMNLLPSKAFTQVHRSFIVNLNKVYTISTNEVHINSKKLPIGRSYKEAVKQRW